MCGILFIYDKKGLNKNKAIKSLNFLKKRTRL